MLATALPPSTRAALAPPATIPDFSSLWQATAASLVPRGGSAAADAALCYLLAEISQKVGKRWLQGDRQPPLVWTDEPPTLSSWQHYAWNLLATRHLYRVEAHVAAVLCRWRRGEVDIRVTQHPPRVAAMLASQAQGFRWLTLLPPGADCGQQASPFEFALHDLCHAAHYFDPAHHVAQRGFFTALARATTTTGWLPWCARMGPPFAGELDHVAADMNGSALFLWTALRKKITNAAKGYATDPVLAVRELTRWLAMPATVAEAALQFSVHRDADADQAQLQARVLLAWFCQIGSDSAAKGDNAGDADSG
ncbi:MAG: hypothetical protein EXR77_08120 [Myxococcales bacterium]|nr:hypothetical protein [Myxococcales bacterium]